MVTIPSTALGKLSDEERKQLLDSVFASTKEAFDTYLVIVDAQLRVFEQRYEILSSDLSEALGRGRLPDTREVNEWLVLVDVRSQLVREART